MRKHLLVRGERFEIPGCHSLQHTISVVLSHSLLNRRFQPRKRDGVPSSAFDVGAQLRIGVRKLLSEDDDGQVFNLTAESLRHESDDTPVQRIVARLSTRSSSARLNSSIVRNGGGGLSISGTYPREEELLLSSQPVESPATPRARVVKFRWGLGQHYYKIVR